MKLPKIASLIGEIKTYIAVLHETKLTEKNSNPLLGAKYNIFRKDRPQKGSETPTAIQNSLIYEELQTVEDGTENN